MTFLSAWSRLLLSVVFLFLLGLGSSTKATIQYEVSLDHPERHLFHIAMTIPAVDGEVLVRMAAWNALYQIRDFSSHIQQVEAFAGSQRVAAEKIDKQTWRIQGTGIIKITYTSYWDESGPFASQLNAEHAFINPAMILFCVPARHSENVSLNVVFSSPSWKPAGALLGGHSESGQNQSAMFNAPSFEALADAPIEVGKIEQFDVPGVSARISVVVYGSNWHKKQVEDDLRRICKYELKLMDGAPFVDYTFLLHFGRGAGGGGMEHMNSTAIGAYSDEYLSGLAAHEFFHLWNVKRIRPASLEPVDDTKEQYTRALWFAEGVTNTYGSYTLVRSGIWSKEQFYGDMSEQITELEARPANRWQSAEQASLDAWFEKYPLYNQPEYSVSYYTKGQILGDLLDILVRDRTDNQRSLDDVMRLMNANFARRNKTYRDSLDVQLSAETVAGSSLEDFFKRYVAGTDPFPYQQILALAGLTMRSAEHRRPALGFSVRHESSGSYVVSSVDPDSPAAQAGLKAEDIILSWNGGEVPRRLEHWLEQQKSGDSLKLQVRRDGQDISLEFRLGEIRETVYQVVEDSHASERARHIREGILRGETAAVMAHR